MTAQDAPACFLAGTLIDTPQGPRPIETLSPGDLVSTANGPMACKFVCRSEHPPLALASNGQLPVRIARGALGDGLPRRDLVVSGGHAIVLEGHLIQAAALVNGDSIRRTDLADWEGSERIVYYNIEFETQQIITAEGLPAESYYDILPRSFWDNYQEYRDLYGDGSPIVELPMSRVNFSRQLPTALKARLDTLAQPCLV
ncbi:Hint domain-containing protein [Cyanobium sp. NIES-981]|uniref:Hint domain-containing protein n=1 Tax=Cyanobium sp. NIES-981 TaxID=1851505 RepID=UPI0012FA22AD|nr:Hint domain-containing protein [Cyanobium sp. NIES-981]